MNKKYFISFIEEYWQGQKEGTWIGRMEFEEVGKEVMYPDEIWIGTFNRDGVEKLMDKYDFREVSERTFKKIKKEIERLREIKGGEDDR